MCTLTYQPEAGGACWTLFTVVLRLALPEASAVRSGNGSDGGRLWSAQLPGWICIACEVPGVSPDRSTAAVTTLVPGSQESTTLPVGCVARVSGAAVAPEEGAAVEDPEVEPE